MDKHQVTKPGNYLYRRPGWENPIQVTVERTVGGMLVIRFSPHYYPQTLDSVPADAIFEEVKQ